MAPFFDSDDDERERPSWREIDRRRDRSRHVSRDKHSRKEKSLRSTWAKQQYLKEADKLFQGVKGGKDHKAALDAIHRAYGTSKFNTSVNKYIKAYGLPTDWGTLILLLDSKKEKVVIETNEALKARVAERSALEKQSFKGKLEVLTLTTATPGIMSAAAAALKGL